MVANKTTPQRQKENDKNHYGIRKMVIPKVIEKAIKKTQGLKEG